MGFFGLLFLLVPLGLLISSIGGLIYVWVKVLTAGRAKNSTQGSDLACCGKCGYPARGAINFACSECGADLREVGIVTPNQRKPMLGPVGFLALWTICLPVPAFTLAGILIAAGPKQSIANESITLTPTSGEYVSIDINNTASAGMTIWSLGQTNPNQLSVSINGNNNQWEWLEVDAAAMTYDASFTSVTPYTPGAAQPTHNTSLATLGSGSATAAFDQSVLLGLMQTSGADPTKAEVVTEADELLAIIQQFPTQGLQNINTPSFTSSQTNQFSMNIPSMWWVLTALLAIPAVWVLGIVLYFVVRKKRATFPAPQTERNPYGPAQFASNSSGQQ